MRGPFTADQLAALVRVTPGDVERWRDLGLLDPNRDGVYDDYDLLRLRLIVHTRNVGRDPQEIADGRFAPLGAVFWTELLFGEAARLQPDQVAERVGLTAEQVVELRTAIGVTYAPVTAADVETLSAMRAFLVSVLPWDVVLEAARVLGDTLRRLADTEMRIIHEHVHEPLAATGLSPEDLAETQQQLGEALLPQVESLLLYVHRQHLLRAAIEDVLADMELFSDEEGPVPEEATIVFCDLASFTPLAEIHGDLAAADVLSRFDSVVRSLVLEHGGTLVKQIGDAFMCSFTSPAGAVRFAVAVDEAVGRERGFPAVRIAVHSGPVLFRLGDYVGHTVNIAARIAGLARANEILLSAEPASAAEGAGIAVSDVGPTSLRGVAEPVWLYRVVRAGARATRRERDPVCGMLIGPDPAARLVQGGFEFAFCSQECLQRFLEDPSRYSVRE